MLVIDGHPAHFTTINKTLLEQHYDLMKTPASSCEFNSIEWLWSKIKRRFRATIVSQVGRIKTQEQLDTFILNTVESFEVEEMQQFTTANRGYI